MDYFRDGKFHYQLAATPSVADRATSLDRTTSFDPRFFDPAYCLSLNGARAITEGRGTAVMFPAARRWLFLKDYQRGGMIKRISNDAYLWTGLERTRAWREFALLNEMSQLNLSVPEAYACRVEQGSLTYRASLIVEVVRNQGSLMKILKQQGFEAIDWRALGEFIGSFGFHRIFHADLNASNILLQQNRKFVLIDFDKSYRFKGIRAPLFHHIYEKRMLRRLRRSLLKVKPSVSASEKEFSDSMWQLMLAGYRTRSGKNSVNGLR